MRFLILVLLLSGCTTYNVTVTDSFNQIGVRETIKPQVRDPSNPYRKQK